MVTKLDAADPGMTHIGSSSATDAKKQATHQGCTQECKDLALPLHRND